MGQKETRRSPRIVRTWVKNASLGSALILILPTIALAQRAGQPKNVTVTGSYGHHPVVTKSKQAQQLFDRGLGLIYALDYSEAAKSFHAAAGLDPTMAMAYWGIAYALGSDYYYHAPADPARERDAFEAVQRGLALSATGPQVERGYLTALSKRYCNCPIPDREKLAVEFKDAMRALAQRYPDDLDAATLYAQSIMNLSPWDLWSPDGTPGEGTPEILAVLESVLKRNPRHLGAMHFYIHAVEASPHPERGLAYADTLPSLSPPIGHLVHMPAHIYIRTGDYMASEQACAKAARVDDSHIQNSPNMFTVLSYLHDLYFLVAAASMDGHYAAAREAANELVDRVSPHLQKMPELQAFLSVQPTVLLRFHRWDDILKLPQPRASLKIANAMWHFARGMAFAATGKVADAETEHRAVLQVLETTPSSEIFGMSNNNKTRDILQIASDVLAAKLAAAKHEKSEAVVQLRDAVSIQDTLKYAEPPEWFYPVRESLGAALFLDGQISEAEQTFRDDLRRNPRNPRSLFGLLQVLRFRGRSHDAGFVQVEFDAAWKGDQQLNLQDF
jgi:tetratricopeptide (TPR) repeat protein